MKVQELFEADETKKIAAKVTSKLVNPLFKNEYELKFKGKTFNVKVLKSGELRVTKGDELIVGSFPGSLEKLKYMIGSGAIGSVPMKEDQELLEAEEKLSPITVTAKGDDAFVINTVAKAGPTLNAIWHTWKALEGKKGSTLTSKSGMKLDAIKMLDNRPNGFIIKFENPEGAKEKLEAAVKKAEETTLRELKKKSDWKASAPERKKEASKFDAKLRADEMKKYDELYGKGTWKRVTYRQEGGDDGYQYVVRVDGRAIINGQTQSQAKYEKLRAVEALAKKEKLGKYADKKQD